MPANIIKTVDLGGGGDFSSLAAFIAWLYNNYNPLDRNACAICRVSSGNTYGDSAAWGSLPSFSGNVTILITTTKDHWFNGIFSSTRYYLATNPTQPTYWYQLVFHRVQIGAPGSPRTGTIKAGLFLCGVVSSATTAVQSDLVANSMIICTTNSQTAISCPGSVAGSLITRNLLLTRTGYTGTDGIYAASLSTLNIYGNHIIRFTTPVDNGGVGNTCYNSTTATSISPNTVGNLTGVTPTFVDETNWNYILSINDTSAKDQYPAYTFGGLPVSLYHNGITGYRFPCSSIGPTDPDPGTYAPWVTKTVNTDGGGDFTSLNAALAWLYSTYPNLVTSNIRAKFICMGTTTDSTNVTTTISTTDPRHYIHIIADDNYRFKGVPNLTKLYKRSAMTIGATLHVILEGIQIAQGTSSLSKAVLAIDCYISNSASIQYGHYINSMIILSTTNTGAYFNNSIMNCTVINTAANGVIPCLGPCINYIAIGAVVSTNYWYYTLGAVTNYSSGVISLFCKYGQSIAFNNSSANDYRLSWSDTAAKYQGIYTGSYLEDVVDVELYPRVIPSSYGADEACAQYVETLRGADILFKPKFFRERLYGIDSLGTRKVLETLYSVSENIYRGALSGRILIRVQKKTLRIHRI